MNNLNFHLRTLEKEQIKYNTSIRKEIIKMRVEINEIENRNKHSMLQLKKWETLIKFEINFNILFYKTMAHSHTISSIEEN